MTHAFRQRERRWGQAWWVSAIIGLAAGAANAQVVRYVRSNAPPGGNGMSWATAYSDLQIALAAAAANLSITQLWIAEGTYKPASPGGARTATFTLRNGLGLYGGFAGNETTLAQRDIAGHPTTLSGDLNGDGPGVFTGPPPASLNDNSFHVVSGSGVNATARLDGLRIVGGAAMGIAPNNAGGGLACLGASPSVDHCMFIGNYAADRGGAISLIAGSNATLTFCGLEQNRTLLGVGGTGFGGGAMYLLDSDASIADCSFVGNRFVPGANGGAILCAASDPVFVRCSFTGNGEPGTFTGIGGAMYFISNSNFEVTQCTFTGNRAAGGGSIGAFNCQASIRECLFQRGEPTFHAEGGGAISNSSTDALIVRCTFDRLAAEGGGAITNINSAPLIVNCRFTGNSCFLFDGGAMWDTGDSSPTLVNCTFTGNASTSGSGGSGAIFHNSTGALVAVNCTFAGNSANPALPGAGAVLGAQLTLRNCIVVHNSPGQLHSSVAATWSCVEGGWPGLGNIASSNPGFVDENGPDNTLGTADDDVRLTTVSPCIDAARNADVPSDAVDLDADGNLAEPTPRDLAMGPRFYNHAATPDTGEGVPPIVDMGAFEVRACPADVSPAPAGNGAVDVNDLLAVIISWGSCPGCPPSRCAGDIAPIVGGASVGDCQINVNDLLAVITMWGTCP